MKAKYNFSKNTINVLIKTRFSFTFSKLYVYKNSWLHHLIFTNSVIYYMYMKKNNLTHARTCVYNVNYHIVWSTKYRRKVLNSKIEVRLKEILLSVAEDKEFIIHEMEVGESDHIHLFVSSHPKNSISYIVKMMKGISGRLLLREFPEITQKLWKGELWNPSYYAETIGSVSEENIKRYILKQEKGE